MKKLCEWCGKEMELTKEQVRHHKRFCSPSCSAKWRNKVYGYHKLSPDGKERVASFFKNKWKDPEFRKKKTDVMLTNNPMHRDGNGQKVRETRLRNGSYTNQFRYGNGKMSPQEEIALSVLGPMGFYFNYAIGTKEARLAFPEENYAKNYKPDFVNLSLKICIEIDGDSHNCDAAHEIDMKKERCLAYYGFKVYRFTNEQVNDKDYFTARVNELCQLG